MRSIGVAILIGSIILFSGFAFFQKQIKTYKEAYDQAYSLIETDPKKAIELIRFISKQNIPVKKEDVFYVRSIATLAATPIFRELEVTKRLLNAIYDVKKEDYLTNSILLSLALADKNEAEVMKFAKSLIYSDYQSHLKDMEPAKMSSIEEVRNYLDPVIKSYEFVCELFEGVDDALAKKAKEIVVALKKQMRKLTPE